MNIASAGSLSDSSQLPHNYNTGLIRDLVRNLLLFFGILPVADTAAEPSIVVGDSAAAEHTVVAAEASSFYCTAAAGQIAAVVY